MSYAEDQRKCEALLARMVELDPSTETPLRVLRFGPRRKSAGACLACFAETLVELGLATRTGPRSYAYHLESI